MEQGMSSDQPIKANKMRTAVLIVLGVSIVINLLFAWNLWKGPKTVSVGTEEKIYKDSINLLKRERVEYIRKVDSLNIANDSLKNIKNEVKIKYLDKIKFVYTADPNQLDSLIREISGIRHR